jgi:hypothetical protein
MSQFEEKMEAYMSMVKDFNIDVSEDLVRKAAKALGPSIYNMDAETVSCSQSSEVDLVIKNFLKGKLGLKDDDATLKKAVEEVCEEMGKGNSVKFRPIFYALLAKKFSKESVYDA